MSKADQQIITELKAKIGYHYMVIAELNERMDLVQSRMFLNSNKDSVEKKIKENQTSEQTNKQTGLTLHNFQEDISSHE